MGLRSMKKMDNWYHKGWKKIFNDDDSNEEIVFVEE